MSEVTFQSLATLPEAEDAQDAYRIVVRVGLGYQQAPLSLLREYYTSDLTTQLSDLQTQVEQLESGNSLSNWPTARTITLSGPVTGSVALDGSADVTLTVTITDDALSVSQVAGLATTLSGLRSDVDAKLSATAPAVSSAKWTTPISLALTGIVRADAVLFDGSTNFSLVTAIDDGALSTAKVAGLDDALTVRIRNDQHWGGSGQDYNALTTSGFFRDDGGVSVNRPATAYGQMTVSAVGDTASQYYATYASNRYFARGGTSSTGSWVWASWVEFYHSGNFNPASKLDVGAAATSASKWTTPITLTLDGDATGSATIDGSGDVTLTVSVVGGGGGGASIWPTPRTITLSGKASGSTTLDGSADVTLNVDSLTVSADDVGLGNVDNTADADKPVSTATQAAIAVVQAQVTSLQDGYTHDQPFAAAVWSINHNLGRRPFVDVVDSAGTPTNCVIEHQDLNNLTVTSAFAFAGQAFLR